MIWFFIILALIFLFGPQIETRIEKLWNRNPPLLACPWVCYCGKPCTVDHRNLNIRCNCGGNHTLCRKPCSSNDQGKCIWINNHSGVHDCFDCATHGDEV